MDIEGLERLLRGLEAGEIRIVARDLTEPSPLAAEVLSARPYAYLDDAPLEERRTQAVSSRRWVDPATAADFGQLDIEAIEGVREEAWPEARSADEMHDALMTLGFVTAEEVSRNPGWDRLLDALATVSSGDASHTPSSRRRPGSVSASGDEKPDSGLRRNDGIWVAAERLPQFAGDTSERRTRSRRSTRPPEYAAAEWTPDKALVEIVRSRLTGLGPVRVAELADSLGVSTSDIDIALAALEGEGYVMRGQFTPGAAETEWCERQLARAHPPLHGSSPAPRDRAGRAARFHALPRSHGSTSRPMRASAGPMRSRA